MKYIYRVEDKDGIGCYVGHPSELRFIETHTHLNGHPLPYYDNKINRNQLKYEICGFLNLDQVMKWFTSNELTELWNEGYDLKRIKVDEITEVGDTQVLAIR